MNSVQLAALVVGQAALLVVVLGLARVVQHYQVDSRRPGPIVERQTDRATVARPVELERLERLTADGLASPVIAHDDLAPLLRELARDAPRGRVSVPPPPRDRRRWLTEVIVDLERAWEIDDQPPHWQP